MPETTYTSLYLYPDKSTPLTTSTLSRNISPHAFKIWDEIWYGITPCFPEAREGSGNPIPRAVYSQGKACWSV